MTNFQRVSQVNEAFNNKKGNPNNIDWDKVRSQCKNILDEFIELQGALGADAATIAALSSVRRSMDLALYRPADLNKVRDALCDINVFSYGAHHMMGIDADRDMESVINGLMTRFIKDEQDEVNTIKRHALKGVVKIRLEGNYPTRVLKSDGDYPDAPRGKFLKSASYEEPVFYTP